MENTMHNKILNSLSFVILFSLLVTAGNKTDQNKWYFVLPLQK